MRRIIGIIAFIALPFSILNAFYQCPEIEIEVEGNKLEIEDLTAPIEIVKVFNESYQLVFQCYGDCPEEVTLENLTDGAYNIDIQSYTNNWLFICNYKKSFSIENSGTPDCSNIEIEIEGNQLIMDNLNAPNKIVKVFDVFYNLIDICYFNCENRIIIPNLLSGLYHVDIQFYTANWQFICDLKEEVLIDLEMEPCDTSICFGDVILTSQTQVDEFCGCSVIEGDLTIGSIQGSNINSLVNFRDLREVKGKLSILRTDVEDIEGLGNLAQLGGDLILRINRFLNSLEGLNNLSDIGGTFFLDSNSKIKDLKGLDRLTGTPFITFTNNSNLSNIDKVVNISNLQHLSISNNGRLKSIPSLTLLDTLYGVNIVNNSLFKDLNFLAPIEHLSGQVNITGNPSLSDCCGLYHLIDEDPFFGTNDGTFNLANNPFACRSIAAITTNCQSNTISCEDIQVSATNQKIIVSGLTATNEIIKVFDENYGTIFNCFGDCSSSFVVDNLPFGLYRINVNFYTEDWIPICETTIAVNLGENGNDIALSDRSRPNTTIVEQSLTVYPNPVATIAFVDLSKFEGQKVNLSLVNQVGQLVWTRQIEKVNTAFERIDLQTFQNGIYFLQINGGNYPLVTKKLIVNRLY